VHLLALFCRQLVRFEVEGDLVDRAGELERRILAIPQQHAGVSEAGLLTLAAGSTIAGNLLILGAASNVIIVESADRRGTDLSFLQFARVGLTLRALHVAICWLFLGS
jgi:Na+/H+ antiporter NhaD/arsenite permease-like protein